MALGIRQAATITEAARQCARMLKGLGRSRLQAEARKALMAADPQVGMAALMDVALRASVKSPAKGIAVLPVLQQHYRHVMEVWNASPSGRHRTAMVRLFRRELKGGR